MRQIGYSHLCFLLHIVLPDLGVIPYIGGYYGDLNNCKTTAFIQVVPSTAEDHAPITGGNMLVVIRITDYVFQAFLSLDARVWIRTIIDRPNKEWTNWEQLDTTIFT